MKKLTSIIALVLLVISVAACVPATAPAQEPSPEATRTDPTAPPEPQPTPGNNYHPLHTRTGIEEIDTVLAAVENGDPQNLRDLFRYSKIACMIPHALGGPPPCRAGEAEGTIVEVLPTLGPEGSFLYKDEIGKWPGLFVTALYAIYKVSDRAYSDGYYPSGEYGAILVGEENSPNSVLQIKDGGIVRLDFILDTSPSELAAVLDRDASKVILEPKG